MNYAFLDIETTGLDPQQHAVIEVGYILEDSDSGEEYARREVSLEFDPTYADPKALEVNGWGKREFAPVMEKPRFAQLLHLDLTDVEVIGNNVQFDMMFLSTFLKEHGLQPSWRYHVVDLKAIAGGALGLKPPWKTDDLCAQLKTATPGDRAHTAMGDAEWNREFFHAIYAFVDA